MPAASGAARGMGEMRAAIEEFLAQARQPVLFEPGEELLPLGAGNFALDLHGSRLTLQAWDHSRNITRRIIAARESGAARLELTVERFARREGQLFLIDMARRGGAGVARRSGRLVFRERFRLFLRRQFPAWKLVELSAEADLEHSLSPAFPRAFLRHGQHGWAAIACPPEGDASAVLSFGLIWLSYLRAREQRIAVEGLAIYVPSGREATTALRLLCLDAATARFELFSYTEDGFVAAIDTGDYGNLDTRLEPCRPPCAAPAAWQTLISMPDVESVPRRDGGASLRVRGLEFAELSGGELLFGLRERRAAREHHASELKLLVSELSRARRHDVPDREHPLYRQSPEAWLESMARTDIEAIDASLMREPVYGQTPVLAGGERGVIDLLATDRSGRLAVIELKASADLHLPLQALDYWIHVKWHLDRGEFGPAGYFPGRQLRSDPPRLLLVSPSLDFHPTTETLLRYFSPQVEVERIGLAVEWRKGLRVMFRLAGAQRPC